MAPLPRSPKYTALLWRVTDAQQSTDLQFSSQCINGPHRCWFWSPADNRKRRHRSTLSAKVVVPVNHTRLTTFEQLGLSTVCTVLGCWTTVLSMLIACINNEGASGIFLYMPLITIACKHHRISASGRGAKKLFSEVSYLIRLFALLQANKILRRSTLTLREARAVLGD